MLRKAASLLLEPVLGAVTENQDAVSRQVQILLSLKYREIAATGKLYPDFEQVGFNVYSKTGEDGILLYILSLIGMTDKRCVDIGCGAVKGSNVANLIINHGFSGLLIDGNRDNIERSVKYFAGHKETRNTPPNLLTFMITAENVNSLLEQNGFSGEIDLLSIDIDGIDYWIWKAIDGIRPRVVLAEYQDILGPDRAWTVPYKPDFNVRDYPENKQHNNYCGASLQALVKLGKQKGYRLVGCNKGGWNAFFVKIGIAEKHLPEVTVESCFRYQWNEFGMENRFPLVKDMNWEQV